MDNQRICARCNNPMGEMPEGMVYDPIRSICGNCADDLREEQNSREAQDEEELEKVKNAERSEIK